MRPTVKQRVVLVALLEIGSASVRELADGLERPAPWTARYSGGEVRGQLEACRRHGWVRREKFNRPNGSLSPWRYELTDHGRAALDG